MKIFYQILVCVFSLLISPLFAQCPPPGFPDSGNTCPEAPILCENLDGYCNTINNNNTPQPFPGCGGQWTLNNDEWFAFYAGTTSITIQVTPTNCSPGQNMGLQGGIYAQCVSQPMDLQCPCTVNPFILSSNNFVVGQIYWFVIDGCGGNVCDYSIDVLSGSTLGAPPANPGPITGLTEVCQNSTTSYSITPPVGATIYNWTLTPNIGNINGSGNSISVNWGNNTTSTQLCVTVANACYPNPTPSCIDIDVIPTPTATISGSGILCQGGGGSVNLTVTFTGEGPWTFTPLLNGVAQTPITTSSNPYTYTVTQAGTYTLQNVSVPGGANNCNGTVSGSATVTTVNITASSAVTNEVCGTGNGAINLSVSGGTSPYTFNWSNGATTEDLANLNAGSYTVTVTDANGCTRVLTSTVNNNNINLAITGTTVANTTCIDGNGSIDVSINPPPGSYTYNWSNGATTQDISNLTPGSYTITVTSGVTCTSTATFTIANNPNAPTITGAATQSTCELSNGSINISVSGGVSPYTFNWSNGATTEDLSNILAGSYTVTVTGANGCTSTASYTVGNNNPPINITANIVANTTCNGGNGSITLNVAPANPNYTFTWSNGATTQNINNLTPGSYSVTVNGGGACTQTATFNVPNNPNNPNVTFTTVQSTCELSNGSINVSVSGGVSPYTFNWSNGSTSEDLTNIPAGSYTVTVTGANGCSSTASITVNNNNPPINITGTVVSNTTCNGNGNGSISINVTPANPNYTYTWSNGATTQNLTNLQPGSYTVTVSAGGVCTQTATFNVGDNPNVPNLNLAATNTTCNQSNGTINLTVSGGVAPYTFNWSNGATTQNLGNIPAGFYSVTVTGANGCSNSAGVNVDNVNPAIVVNANIVANTLCNGNGNGSITLIISPSGSYTYLWSNGATTPNISNLVQGTYTVTVTGSGSCSQVASFTIPDNPNGPMITGVTTGTTCDLSNGNVNISVSGGVPPYTYDWSNGATTQDISNIPAGTYSVTATAANGCTNIANYTIGNNNPPITVTATTVANTFCVNGNGSINVSVSPPAGPYTYIWSNGATTQDLSNIPGGTYTVTVNGLGSCYETATFNVDDDPNLPNLILDYNPSTCGLSNGDIDLMVSGGTLPYTYNWSSGQTTQDLNNVPPDLYFVTVTAANGCSSVDGGDLPDDIVPITLSGVVLPDNSCASNNGRITLTVDPPPPGVSILWSTGYTGLVLNNLAAGTYSVTVSAGGTCTSSATYVVQDESQPPNVSYAVTPATCGISSGAIDLTVTGGLVPITYAWSNAATTQDLTNLPPGNYTVTVTTAGSCTAISTIPVPSNNVAINLSETITHNTSCVAPNGTISVAVAPAGTYTYAWSNGATTSSISNLAPGNYTVTVTTGVTCTATASYNVSNNAVAPNLAATATPSTCSLSNGAADANASDGVSPYTFLWSNSATTEQISNLAPGAYTVTVTGANGCSSNASVNISNNDIALNISGVISENTSCTTGDGAVNISVAPVGSYTYNWSNGPTTEDIDNLNGGNYSVTVSAGGSCTSTSTFIVTNNTQNPVISPAVTPAICSNDNGAIDLTISGATAPYTFNWTNSASTEDLVNIFPGLYSVTVTAANGCTADTTLNVANNSSTFTLSGAAAPQTNCVTDNGAIDLIITPPGNYTILWSTGAVTEDVSGLPYGIYTVSVTDPAGGDCTATASFIVEDGRTYPSTSQSLTPDVCNLQNGGINLSVSGGVAPYNFLWSNGLTTEDLNNIAAGAYSVTVTGTNSCSAETSANVPGNTINFSLSGTTMANTVCGTNNGSVNLTVTPAGAYTFMWSNSATSEDLNSMPGGNYAVTVSAGGSCANLASYTVGDNTLSPVISEIVSPAFCAKSNGGIDLSVGGGVAPYNFLWSNSLTNEDLNNIPAGNYAVTVTGANGCTSFDAFIVPDNIITPGISGAVTPNNSCLINNGGIVLNVAPPDTYAFIWSNSQTSQNLVNVAPGDYSVTVSSGGNCTAVASFDVPDDTESVLASGTQENVLCFGGNDGSIDLTANGGVLPYQFNWSPAVPGNPEDPTNIFAGNYTVTVTDAAGCSATATFNILQPAAALQIVCAATATVSSPGQNDGKGQVNISGGTAPYIVNWTPGGTPANAPAGIFNINNLTVGTCSVTVTDANDCTTVCDFTVNLIDCNTAVGTMSSTLMTLCGPGCLTPNYNAVGQFIEPGDVLQFILHEGNSNEIENEIARSTQPTFCFDPALMSYGITYYISVVAGNNDSMGNVLLNDYCTVISFGTPVVFREKPIAAIAPPETLSCALDKVSLIGSSDLNNSTFQWTTSGGSIASNPAQAVVSVDAAGVYTLIVNLNGCKDTASVMVDDLTNQPEASISFNPSDVLDCTINEIILSGSAEGTMAANTVWILNGAFYSGGNPVPINTPGLYEFIVLDTITFCADTATILVNENQAYPPLFLNPPGLLTCANQTVTLTGGSPIPGVLFKWAIINASDTTIVGTGASLVVTTPGTYYFIGSDPANTCTNFLTATVNADQTLPVADAGLPFDIACFGEIAALDGNGSSGGVSLLFQWTTTEGNILSGKNTPAPQISEPGTYFLLVTNSVSGCTDTDEVVIVPKPPTAELTIHQPPCFEDKGAIVIDNVIGAKPPLKYSLNNGATFTGNNIFTNLDGGTYTIFIVDANGCTATVSATVDEVPLFEIFVEPKVVIQLGDSYQINTQVNVPLSEISDVLWKPSTSLSCDTCLNPIASPFTSTQYRIFVTNEKGCKADARLQLIVDKELHIYVPNIFSPDDDGHNDIFMIFADPKSVVKIKSFQIFSRWGELVSERYDFEPNNPTYGWDGTHQGQDLNPAVFVWYAIIELVDGQEVLYEGDVTLQR